MLNRKSFGFPFLSRPLTAFHIAKRSSWRVRRLTLALPKCNHPRRLLNTPTGRGCISFRDMNEIYYQSISLVTRAHPRRIR